MRKQRVRKQPVRKQLAWQQLAQRLELLAEELLALLAASKAPLARALDAATAQSLNLEENHYDEAGFRFALNEDAMATEKLSEGIRAFCVDTVKLDQLLLAA